jgi:hypothetical protein
VEFSLEGGWDGYEGEPKNFFCQVRIAFFFKFISLCFCPFVYAFSFLYPYLLPGAFLLKDPLLNFFLIAALVVSLAHKFLLCSSWYLLQTAVHCTIFWVNVTVNLKVFNTTINTVFKHQHTWRYCG